MKKLVHLTFLSLIFISFKTYLPPKKGDVQFFYSGSQDKIKTAIKQAKEVLDDKKFYKGIIAKGDFTHTHESPAEISKWLYETDLKLNVRGYNGGEDTRTLAYVTSEHPGVIFINTQKLNERSAESVANTLIHELVHSLDRKIEDARFGHAGNSSVGKKDSAPYAIGRLAQRILEGNAFVEGEEPVIEERESIDDTRVERTIKPD
ncbi:MAG TPA: hypothetical protein VEX63_00555 [Flavisolibacter sp.]|nr:hypothetical protein [Flavisolibacter sp.]